MTRVSELLSVLGSGGIFRSRIWTVELGGRWKLTFPASFVQVVLGAGWSLRWTRMADFFLLVDKTVTVLLVTRPSVSWVILFSGSGCLRLILSGVAVFLDARDGVANSAPEGSAMSGVGVSPRAMSSWRAVVTQS